MHKPFFAWRHTYSVGHSGLDAQHRHLVPLINEIHTAECSDPGPCKLRALLHMFEIEAINHYRDENSIIDLLGGHAPRARPSDSAAPPQLHDALINEHYAEHAQSLVALESIIHIPDAELGRNYCSLRLKTWFDEHASVDANLKSLLAARSCPLPGPR